MAEEKLKFDILIDEMVTVEWLDGVDSNGYDRPYEAEGHVKEAKEILRACTGLTLTQALSRLRGEAPAGYVATPSAPSPKAPGITPGEAREWANKVAKAQEYLGDILADLDAALKGEHDE
jgi:hypothetical protein